MNNEQTKELFRLARRYVIAFEEATRINAELLAIRRDDAEVRDANLSMRRAEVENSTKLVAQMEEVSSHQGRLATATAAAADNAVGWREDAKNRPAVVIKTSATDASEV